MSGDDNISWTTRSVTATTTATADDYVLLCNPAAGAIVVNLPAGGASAAPAGRMYAVYSTGTTNTVTIDPAGAALIDGAATKVLAAAAPHAAMIVTDGTNWFSVSSY